jgi:hypothetical protein
MCKNLKNVDEIKELVTYIRSKRTCWTLSLRSKNLITLTSLGINEEIAFDFIYQHLKWQDYVSGPETRCSWNPRGYLGF